MVSMESIAPIVADTSRLDAAWHALERVADPEIPVVSIVELCIVRDVALRDGKIVVTVTPTYSGCPATEVIAADIESALATGALGGVLGPVPVRFQYVCCDRLSGVALSLVAVKSTRT